MIDIRRFGGLRHVMPWTHRTFLVGCLALAGIFPFAGFWSKDQIVAAVHTRAHPEALHATATREPWRTTRPILQSASSDGHALAGGDAAGLPPRYAEIFGWLYWVALGTAFLTAFYTFRAYFLTFFGPQKVPEEAGHHAHESPPVMWVPLVILAVFAFGVGFVVESRSPLCRLSGASPSLGLPELQEGANSHAGEFHLRIARDQHAGGRGRGSVWRRSSTSGDQREVEAHGPATRAPVPALTPQVLSRRDLPGPRGLAVAGLAWCSYACDRWLIDGLVNLCGRIPVWLGRRCADWQTGLVPFYSLMMVLGTVLIRDPGPIFWGGG